MDFIMLFCANSRPVHLLLSMLTPDANSPAASPESSVAGSIKAATQRSQAGWFGMTLMALLLLCSTAIAQDITSNLRFENAGTYVDNGVYYLDAFASIDIGEEPERALANGVELHFLVELAVLRTRRWWLDAPVLERRLRYKLYFYDLTGHYRIDDLQSGESANYRSLSAALLHLGRINRYALIEVDKLKKWRKYRASISVSLDSTLLPAPLAAQAVVSREWNLQSEVFQWSLN